MNITKQRKISQNKHMRRITYSWESLPKVKNMYVNWAENLAYIFPPTLATKVFKEGKKIIHLPD